MLQKYSYKAPNTHLKTRYVSLVLLQKSLEISVGVDKIADCGNLHASARPLACSKTVTRHDCKPSSTQCKSSRLVSYQRVYVPDQNTHVCGSLKTLQSLHYAFVASALVLQYSASFPTFFASCA